MRAFARARRDPLRDDGDDFEGRDDCDDNTLTVGRVLAGGVMSGVETKVEAQAEADHVHSNAAADADSADAQSAGARSGKPAAARTSPSEAVIPAHQQSGHRQAQRPSFGNRIFGLPGDPSRTRRLANVLGVFLLVDALIAGIAIALLSGGTDNKRQVQPVTKQSTVAPPTSVSPTAAALSAPVAWMQRELPSGAVVLADLSRATQVTQIGLRAVVTPSATSAATVQYVLSTPALRDASRSNTAKAKLLAISAPIASFGTGASAVVVREVTGISASQLAADRSIDAANRHDAEQELLDNRNLTTGKGVAAILQAGGLDMRAATVVVLLANAGPTQLTSIAVDPAEQAAGIPARRIVITAKSGSAVTDILNGLPQAYRPTSNTELPNGAQRLIWPLDPDPTTS